MNAIPVLILSGFLGSGKTTLLLRLVHEARSRGLQPAILMNELGKRDIDGHLLQQELQGMSIEKLLDGCVCCDKKSEVAGSLEQLALRSPDLIFIELTGVANPEEIVDCLTEPALLSKVRLKHIVTVLDAEWTLEYNSIFSTDRQLVDTLRGQIAVADLLLVNKMDLVPPSRLTKIEKAVRKHNETAPMHYTTQSQIDPELLLHGIAHREAVAVNNRASAFSVIRPQQQQRQQPLHPSDSISASAYTRSYSRLVTMTLPVTGLLSAKSVEKFLKSIGTGLLRAKGYLRIQQEASVQLLQMAGGRFNWQTTAYTGDHYLVLIGLELSEAQIRDMWQRLTLD
ncbi:CobW family GTP-binding protein [Paenibacillus koleovorans]|uniref:CobW family GTP-binding protein n=1 Tax=Paenibacillus koleovorans TaxID=121608 RepID=UPI001FEA7993|nr:CobW family GTP-binding protein [Paenibacillus koleovorans]